MVTAVAVLLTSIVLYCADALHPLLNDSTLYVAGKAQALGDFYELDASIPEEYRWRQISTAKESPAARARHCAVAVSTAAHPCK